MDKTALSDYETFLKKIIIGISEVADITGVPVRKLRYWQDKGIITPVEPDSSVRKFNLGDVKKIILIKELLDDGYTLDAAALKVEKRYEKINSILALIAL